MGLQVVELLCALMSRRIFATVVWDENVEVRHMFVRVQLLSFAQIPAVSAHCAQHCLLLSRLFSCPHIADGEVERKHGSHTQYITDSKAHQAG